MAVTDGQAATLRAYLTGDTAEYRRLLDEGVARGDGWNALNAACLYVAANNRFGRNPARTDVIAYVASVRQRLDREGRIDQMAAERVILAAVSDEDPSDLDDVTMGRVQAAMVVGLVDDAAMNSDQLDAFLSRARVLADKWMS